MKRLWLAAALCSCGPRQEETMQNDAALEQVRAALPDGWTMTLEAERIVFQRKEPAWVLHENRINAPVNRETPGERAARIRKHGKSTVCRVVYRIQPRWSAQQVADLRRKNAEIEEAIAALPKKHEIVHLRSERLSRKGEDVYVAKTPDDEKRIAAWRKELGELRARQFAVPRFHSRRYSLFFDLADGREDDFTSVDPPSASEESCAIEARLQELLEKP